MKEKVLGFIDKIRNARYFVKLIYFAVTCFICGVVSLILSGVTFAWDVNYGGEKIATVSSIGAYRDAEELAAEKIAATDGEKYLYKPTFSLILTRGQYVDSLDKVRESILDNTSELIKSVALMIDGKEMAYAESADVMNSYIEKRLACYNVVDAENAAEFVNDVAITDKYCVVSDYSSSDYINEALSKLSVKTTAKYRQDIVVSFDTVTQKTNEKLLGYRQVAVDGVNGLNHSVEQVVYIDGIECERTMLEPEVVTTPVNKVIIVGTAYSNTEGNTATTNMVFPIARTSYFITSPFAERRNGYSHKGVDIATNKGTPIYAVQEGTVLEAGWHSDYGYHVKINHGNGVITHYAHSSELYVSAGEEVSRGQIIAAVGSTGWSTGPHLHLEMTIDGKYVDPIKYIGK